MERGEEEKPSSTAGVPNQHQYHLEVDIVVEGYSLLDVKLLLVYVVVAAEAKAVPYA